ncbi:MAG: hypothetical protein ACI936_004193 [Paraglaciecola sp.]
MNAEALKKLKLALSMLKDFVDAFPDITIKGVLGDALYGTRDFMDKALSLTHGALVISQLRSNQCVLSKNSKTSVNKFSLGSLA